MLRLLSLTILLTAGFLLVDCGLFTQKGTNQDGNKYSSNVGEVKEGETTSLEIESGGAVGTQVTVPPGALAAGTVVSVAEAETPAAFAAVPNIETGSVPVVVQATGANDESIVDLSTPMTLAIPISGTAALAEKTLNNLCAFLETPTQELYLWRRTSLAINKEGTLASLTTVKLGVFQLVFCGTDTVESFQDVEETGVASGDTTPLLAQLTMPAAKFDFGQHSICGGIIGMDLENMTNGPAFDEAFMAFGGAVWEGKDLIVRFPYREGLSEADLDHDSYLIGLDFRDEACPTDPDPDAKNLTISTLTKNTINFIVSKEDLVSGAAKGMAGTTPFGLIDVTINIGTPEETLTWTGESPTEACVVFNMSFSGAYSATITSDGLIGPGGNSTFPLSTTEEETPEEGGQLILIAGGASCEGISFDEKANQAEIAWATDLLLLDSNTTGTLYVRPQKIKASTMQWDTAAGTGSSINHPTDIYGEVKIYAESDLIVSDYSFDTKEKKGSIAKLEKILVPAGGIEKEYNFLVPNINEPYYLKTCLAETNCSGQVQYVFARSATEESWPTPVNPVQ